MTYMVFLVCSMLGIAAQPDADELRVLPAKIEGVAPADMLHAYWMRQVHAALDRRAAEYEKLKTAEQWAAHQKRMREFFIDQLGGFPERTPLEPKVVARIPRDGYTIEKVIYQSRPGHYVTGLFYLPEGKPPFPGVLVPCGHSDNGKASEPYQRASILLAKSGMAVLCYDPIDQGERFQLLDEKGKPLVRGTIAHCLVGVGSILLGRNTATFRIWDGIRSIDYLASRPEVDPQRIGCTGNSGGGTLTSYLMALDERIVAAAPSCYLTSFRRLLETIGPQDAEQNIHAQIAFGMDHADYVLMRAPRPTLMCVATQDYFDITGAWDTFRQAKRCYTRLGFSERVDLVEADEKHGFTPVLRTAATRWMRRWLLGKDDAIVETPSAILTDPEALCTPEGQVMRLPGARSVYDINRDLEAQLAAVRKPRWAQDGPQKMLEEVRRITGIRRLSELPLLKAETVGLVRRSGYRIDKLILHPEPGLWLPALAFVPEKPIGQSTLYLHGEGKQTDAAPDGPIEKLVRQGHLVLAVDLAGLGETQKTEKSAYATYLGADWKDLYLAYLLGRSYLAMRAEQVLQCARLAAEYQSPGAPRAVHLVAIGQTGPAALHAAALEPALFASVRLKNCLTCWADVVRTPRAKNQMANVVHRALTIYDLPDLAATLPKERLTLVDPVGPTE